MSGLYVRITLIQDKLLRFLKQVGFLIDFYEIKELIGFS